MSSQKKELKAINGFEEFSEHQMKTYGLLLNDVIGGNLSRAEGRLLTLMDAFIENDRQCENIKSLIRKALWEEFHDKYYNDWIFNIVKDNVK
jgi:hypothetical protein